MSEKAPIFCQRCYRDGHFSDDCPEKNEAAERLRSELWDRGQISADEFKGLLDAALAAERRATADRLLSDIENAVAKPGAFPKGDLMRMLARLRDEEAAR